MVSSNLAVLTNSHKVIAAKKRAKREQIKEVVFDDTARREFLTGFHKRKLQKKEDAKKKAIDREKQERQEARREKRKLLAERAAKNAAETEKAYGASVDEEAAGEWSGIAGPSRRQADPVLREEEYEYEEEVATVTVVEDFDPDALIHGPNALGRGPQLQDGTSSPSDLSGVHDVAASTLRSSKKLPGTKPRQIESSHVERTKAKSKTNTKAKDKKYQTAAARKVDRLKQKRRQTEKAERAGGKASRKSVSVRRKR